MGNRRSNNSPRGPRSRSWANVARVMTKGYNLTYVAPSMVDGELIVDITPDIVAEENPPLNQCVVGRFLGRKLYFKLTEEVIKKTWGAQVVDVRMHDSGYYFIHISDDSFRRKVLDMGHISIQNCIMMLQKWHSKLKLKKENHDTLPIWTRLKDIPLSLWSQSGIGSIASAIGNPLYVDAQTEGMKRLSFARVCIEIKATQPRPEVITLRWDGDLIPIGVEYEWKPPSYGACEVYGHKHGMTGFPCATIDEPPVGEQRPPPPQTQNREQ
ncbi:uncharacterized protein LOC125312849 [Rhodamnia argentea]|uniref:Uncharacterized protein LOC125312849 n=1 Tax=Rhodamnia argentea TaxID=178133 RepID=A0ABM3GVR6_9MYRT|nr:uncharacterized protein LOC125312849 [Rhodamnia argentea]